MGGRVILTSLLISYFVKWTLNWSICSLLKYGILGTNILFVSLVSLSVLEAAIQSCCQLGTGVLKICSKLSGEHPSLLCNFIEIKLWHECPPVNLLHIFRASFLKNTSGRLLLQYVDRLPRFDESALLFIHNPFCY